MNLTCDVVNAHHGTASLLPTLLWWMKSNKYGGAETENGRGGGGERGYHVIYCGTRYRSYGSPLSG